MYVCKIVYLWKYLLSFTINRFGRFFKIIFFECIVSWFPINWEINKECYYYSNNLYTSENPEHISPTKRILDFFHNEELDPPSDCKACKSNTINSSTNFFTINFVNVGWLDSIPASIHEVCKSNINKVKSLIFTSPSESKTNYDL